MHTQATGVSSKRLSELHKEDGDWGDVAQSCRSTQGMLVAPAPLTVAGVYGSLRKIADERGDKSTARKQATVRLALSLALAPSNAVANRAPPSCPESALPS